MVDLRAAPFLLAAGAALALLAVMQSQSLKQVQAALAAHHLFQDLLLPTQVVAVVARLPPLAVLAALAALAVAATAATVEAQVAMEQPIQAAAAAALAAPRKAETAAPAS